MGARGKTAVAAGLALVLGLGAADSETAATPPAAQTGALPGDISTGTIITRPQILTLDQDRLYADSLFGKALEKASTDAVAALVAENHQIEADLTAEEKALTEARATLTAEAFKPLAEAFDVKVEQVRATQEAKSKALQEARDGGRKRFFTAVLPVLAELMRQEGALAILNKNAVILSFDSIDTTAAAIAAINVRLGDGSGAAPAPLLAPAPPLDPAPPLNPAPAPAP